MELIYLNNEPTSNAFRLKSGDYPDGLLDCSNDEAEK